MTVKEVYLLLAMKTPLLSAEQRRQAVELVVRITAGTYLAPQRYELRLLKRFALGELTISQVEELLDATVYQVLYHSQATIPMDEENLQPLLNWSRVYNNQHDITGLLLYSGSKFVQLLEGKKDEIQRLFAQIRKDTRHKQIITIIEESGPRLYADWSMVFGHVAGMQLDQTLQAIQTQAALPSLSVTDLHLQTLLKLFSSN